MLQYRKHIACRCNRRVAATLRPPLSLDARGTRCVARMAAGREARGRRRLGKPRIVNKTWQLVELYGCWWAYEGELLRRRHSRRTAAQHVTYSAPFPLGPWQRNSSRDLRPVAKHAPPPTALLHPGARDGHDRRAASFRSSGRNRRRGWCVSLAVVARMVRAARPPTATAGVAVATIHRDIVRETDHEKARYAWNYRRCRLTDCGALFAPMVAR
jgi:hypothetical protein